MKWPLYVCANILAVASAFAQQPNWATKIPNIPGRQYGAMVYDAARNQIVLFGGRTNSGDSNDTWVWDGFRWLPKTPAHQPSKRSGVGMAYDAVHQRVVLFGGLSGFVYSASNPAYATAYGTPLADTWTWDGNDWTDVTPAGSPAGRGLGGMTYDAIRQRVVLFGGFSANSSNQQTFYNDTWTWDGTSWTQQHPINSPSARKSLMMTWDGALGQVLLVGGQSSSVDYYSAASDAHGKSDTWVWDGTNWTVKEMWGPLTRWDAAIAYDSDRRRVVLVGGRSPGGYGQYDFGNDAWEWDGQSWRQTIYGSWGTGVTWNFYFRRDLMMAYDPVRCQMIVFGGMGPWDDSIANDTYYYTPSGFMERAPLASESKMVYDAARQQMVMFGGSAHDVNASGQWAIPETYVSDGVRWQRKFPATSPQWRMLYSMAYDAARQQVVMFGGQRWANDFSLTYLNDTWVWDGTTWTQKSPAHAPDARMNAQMTYDPIRQKIVLTGGYPLKGHWDPADPTFHTFIAPTDTWVWDGNDWTQLNPAHTPIYRTGAAFAWDPVRNQAVLFGGWGQWYSTSANSLVAGVRNDTWVWDGADWTQLNPSHSPSGRQSSMDWDPNLGKMVLFGGDTRFTHTNFDAIYNDTWTWDGADWAQASPAYSPAARTYYAMAFNPLTNQMMMYGGTSENTPTSGGNLTTYYIDYDGDTVVWTPPETTGAIVVQTNLDAAGYTIAGPTSYSGSGSSTDWSKVLPGNYTITYAAVAGYYSPAAETQTLAAGGTIVFGRGYTLRPGSINVSANISAAAFTIQGETAMSGSGLSFTNTSAPPGTYTINWLPVTGYVTPAPSSATLTAAGSITFTGTYTLFPSTGTIAVTTNLASASFEVSGPASYSGTNSLTQSGALAGTYTVTFNPIDGYVTPPQQTKTLVAGNSISFAGTYTVNTTNPTAGWMMLSPNYPPPRNSASFVYDAARGQTVMFGGHRGNTYGENDTWVWDGARWMRKAPATSPPGRFSPLMVYDGAHQVVMMMGGSNLASGANTDVWLWDGSNWTLKVPAHPVLGSLWAYDAAHQRVVMTRLNSSTYVYDTWTWDGNDWTQQTPAVSPGYTGSESAGFIDATCMAYDAAHGRIVLYGGDNYWSETHTWLWDGANWTDAGMQQAGPEYNNAVYDSARNRLVAFGGADEYAGIYDSSQLWVWDGTKWVLIGSIPTRPPNGGPMVFDAARSVVTQFATGTYNDLWTWDGSSNAWVQKTLAATGPLALNGAAAYDSARNQAVLYGGMYSYPAGYNIATWTWNGVAWSQANGPQPNPARTSPAMAFDPVHSQAVLFGGSNTGTTIYYNETWTWNGIQWSLQSPAARPPGRIDSMMVWDAARQKILLFGGKVATGADFTQAVTNDTWVWDGSNWTQLSPSNNPPARGGGKLVYDEASQKVILFGGYGTSGSKLGDQWTWDGANWTQVSLGTAPAARSGHVMTYDSYRHRTILFGGQSGVSATSNFSDTWIWDGSSWTQQNPALSPPAAVSALGVYDSARHQTLLWGGQIPTNVINEMWAWGDATGGVTVTTNLSSAPVSVSGPAVFSGTGGLTAPAALAGDYTVVYGPVAGYTAPAIETKTLVPGGQISFTGTYTSVGQTGGINVTTNLSAATFNITGAASYSGGGASASWPNCPAGSYTITFGAVSGYATPASQTQTLTAGGTLTFTGAYLALPHHFTVSGFVSPISSGNTSTFTVTALDSGNGVVTTYTGTVTFSSSDAAAGLPANYTFKAADSGSAQFTAALNTAGTQTITVKDVANNAITGTQSGIVVTAGSAGGITPTAGTPQNATVGTAFPTSLKAKLTDTVGNPIANQNVIFTAPSSGASGAFSTTSSNTVTVQTDSSGIATAPTFTANTIAGTYPVTATYMLIGQSLAANIRLLAPRGSSGGSFSLTNLPAAATTLTIQAGDNQSTVEGTPFATALAAKVADTYGNAVAGVTVTFTVNPNSASGAFPGSATTATAATDTSGIATAPALTANSLAGSFTVTASAAGTNSGTVHLTNIAGTGATLSIYAGNNQTATVGAAFANSFAVKVTDSGGNPVSGVSVTFAAPISGAGGSFTGSATVATNSSGIATAPAFTANSTPGTYSVRASASGIASAVNFSATNVAGAAYSVTVSAGSPQTASINSAFPTALQAVVKDSYGNAVSGVTVNFSAPTSGATATLSATSAVTNSSGIASITATANGTAGSYSVTASVSGLSGTATFALTNVLSNVTVQTSPAGLAYSVDGVTYTTAHAFTFTVGTAHTLSVAAAIPIATGSQYTFSNWSDSGSASHTITVASGSATYTANFAQQYLLTTSASPAGTGSVTPASGFCDAGSTVWLHASSAGGAAFRNWTGPVASPNLPDTTVTMSGPLSVVANFQSSNAALTPNPASVQYYLGTDPSTAATQVSLSSAVPLSYNINLSAAAQSLISVSPMAGTAPTLLTITPLKNLNRAAGQYAASFDVLFADGGKLTEDVVVQIYPMAAFRATPDSLSFTAQAGTTDSQSKNQAITAYTRNFPFNLTVDYGSTQDPAWLSLSISSGTTPLTFTVTANPTGLVAGTHQANLVATSSSAGNSPFTIPITFLITPAPPVAPVITVTDIRNAASLLTGPASPNEILSAFGSFPGCTSASVLVDGASTAVFYSSTSQINFLMPARVVSEPSAAAQFVCNSITSSAITIPIATAAPGLFTVTQSGKGQAALVNQDATIASPCTAGNYVQIYGTGFGPYNPPDADGLQRLAATISATINGAPVSVLYAGQAPGYTTGLQQINLMIPSTAPKGTHQLVLTIGGVQSQVGVTLTVQ